MILEFTDDTEGEAVLDRTPLHYCATHGSPSVAKVPAKTNQDIQRRFVANGENVLGFQGKAFCAKMILRRSLEGWNELFAKLNTASPSFSLLSWGTLCLIAVLPAKPRCLYPDFLPTTFLTQTTAFGALLRALALLFFLANVTNVNVSSVKYFSEISQRRGWVKIWCCRRAHAQASLPKTTDSNS